MPARARAERLVVIAACPSLERPGHRLIGLVVEAVAVGELDPARAIGGGRGVAP